MKIQLNSLEALERLIGGDSEVEIEIRNSIVQEFTKKHLKALVNEILAKEVIQEAARQAKNQLREEFFKREGNIYTKYFLTEEVKKDLYHNFRMELYKEIIEEIKLPEQKQKMIDVANEAIEYGIKEYAGEYIKKQMENKIRKEILEKL